MIAVHIVEVPYQTPLEMGAEHAGDQEQRSKELLDRAYDLWYAPYYNDYQKIVGCLDVAVDVTERQERASELRRAGDMAEELSELKSALLANMNLEFRTPLTNIIGYSDVLRQHVPDELYRFIDSIRDEGARLLQMLDRVLTLAQLKSGEYTLDPQWIDVKQMVQRVVASYQDDADKNDLVLGVEVTPKPIKRRVDSELLGMMISNVVENAIKCTEDGSIAVELEAVDQGIRIQVDDTGIGIHSEKVDRMLEAFQQEQMGIDRPYNGMGLGLTVVKSIAELVDGEVQIHSEKGAGTSVCVLYPCDGKTGVSG